MSGLHIIFHITATLIILITVGYLPYGYSKEKGIPTQNDGDCIERFDLEAEKWTTISGPYISHDHSEDNNDVWREYISMSSSSTLAELKGYLDLAHNFSSRSLLDLWFLIDGEKCIWVKQYSIWTEEVIPSYMRIVKPLLLLDDGRIVILLGHRPGVLYLYDPTTIVFSRLDTKCVDEVGLYTGSALSLQSALKV